MTDQEHDPIMADGIYFNMPEATYHRLHRLSASGIKDLLVSVPTFWARSWMNSERQDGDDDSKARILGRAYHAAIFEPDHFESRYAMEPDLDDIENLLTSDAAVCAELKALDQTQKKAGESPEDRAQRLIEIEPSFNVKSLIMEEFAETLGDRQPIAARFYKQILRDIDRIAKNPEVQQKVSGGASEITILSTCPDSGIRMKSRIDKLQPDCFVDLKSFDNSLSKPVNQAIRDQVQYYRYYLSMRVYQVAIAMIREQNLQIMDMPGSAPPASHTALIDTVRASTMPHQPILFFQEKNGIPNLLLRYLKLHRLPDGVDMQSIGAEDHSIKNTESALCQKADLEIARAKQLFSQAMEIYGPDSEWYPFDMIGDIGDDDFRDWFLDSTPA